MKYENHGERSSKFYFLLLENVLLFSWKFLLSMRNNNNKSLQSILFKKYFYTNFIQIICNLEVQTKCICKYQLFTNSYAESLINITSNGYVL